MILSSTYSYAVSLDSISPSELLRYAKRVRYGINTDINLERAAKIYSYLAKKGNTDAQRELGCMFLNGEGVPQNYKAARFLLKKACLANDDKAMCAMARIYQYGVGIKTNKTLAFKLYLRAAHMGNPKGCYGAGNMLYKGQGVKQNYQKAEEILLKGSEKGNAKCDFLLANYYAYGFLGGTPDYSKAKEFLNKAVQNGHGWTVDMTLFNKWIPLSISFKKSSDNNTLYAYVNRLNASKHCALKPVMLTLQRDGTTTNISNVLLDGRVSVSPLPVRDDFTVTLSVTSATNVNVSIFNLAGMKVADYGTRQLNVGSNRLSFHSTLSAGEYILKVKGKGVREVLKFIHL